MGEGNVTDDLLTVAVQYPAYLHHQTSMKSQNAVGAPFEIFTGRKIWSLISNFFIGQLITMIPMALRSTRLANT